MNGISTIIAESHTPGERKGGRIQLKQAWIRNPKESFSERLNREGGKIRMVNRAAVLTELGKFEFREVPMPKADPDGIVLKLEAVGVCGSDVHYYKHGRISDFVVQFPFILGHECAGTVVEVGSNVRHLKVGDRAALEPGVPCGKCEMCRTGHYNLCPDVKFLATPPYDGCLMNYISFPAAYAYKLPDNVSAVEGALVEPLTIGINAALTGGVKLGDNVLVLGSGCIGLVTLLAARAYGAAKVMVSDVIPLRLQTAEKLGAIAIDSGKEDLPKRVLELTDGRGADVVIDCAGFSQTVTAGIRAARQGARMVIVGMGAERYDGIPNDAFTVKELTLTGIFRYKNLYATSIRAIESGSIDIKGIVSNLYKFEDVAEAFRVADECPVETVKNVIVFDDGCPDPGPHSIDRE